MANNLIIRASAGTGKTFQLSNRYIQLLLEDVPIETILASTFTRNAAGEILERILHRLAEAALDPKKCRELSGHIYGKGNEEKISQEKILKTLANFAKNLNRARVSTIDSFFGQIAGSFAPELGFPIEWKIADDVTNRRNIQRAIAEAFDDPNSNIEDLIYDLFKGESKKSLTAEILKIIKDHLDLFRETDKDTREAEKDAWHKVPDPKGNPYSDEKRSSIIEALQLGKEETYNQLPEDKKEHNYAYDFLNKCNELISLYGSTHRESVAKNTLFVNVNIVNTKTYRKTFLTMTEKLAKAIADTEKDVETCFLYNLKLQTEATYTIFSDIVKRLDTIKSKSGEYSFDDIPYYLEQVFKKFRGEQLDFRLDTTIDHLLLDEFQDTSIFQWKILEPIADLVVRANSDKARTSFFCVGDTKQAIYQWRGGMPEIFANVESKYEHNVQKLILSTNRRSCPVVLKAVNTVFETIAQNEFIAKLLDADKKVFSGYEQKRIQTVSETVQDWQDAFEHHEFPKPDEGTMGSGKELTGYVALEVPPKRDTLSADQIKSFAETLHVESGQINNNLFGYYTAWRIKKLHDENPDASIGILFRTRAKLSETAEILKQIGMDISQDGGNPLTNAECVRSIVALLRLAEHPGDKSALFRVISLSALVQFLPPECRPQSENIAEIKVYENTAFKLSLYLRDRIMTEGLGTFIREAANTLIPICNDREKEKLGALVESAFQFEREQGTRIDRFIHLTETRDVSLPGDSDIHLLTIHGAKGLEYDIVVLPELASPKCSLVTSSDSKVVSSRPANKESKRKLPSIDSPDVVCRNVSESYFKYLPPVFFDAYTQNLRSEINGSLDLLYVAMTRAKRELIMIANQFSRTKKGKIDSKSCNFQNILITQLEGKGTKNTDDKEAKNNSSPPVFAGEIIYQDGDPDWYANERSAPAPAEKPSAPSADPPLVSVRKNPIDFNSAEEVRAPSDHGFQRQWFPSRQLFDRGTAIHACFEQIEWLDGAVPSREELRKHLTENVFRGQKAPLGMDDLLDGFIKLCEDPTVKKVLSSSFYAGSGGAGGELQVYRERPYIAVSSTKPGRELGIIDRLVVRRVNGKAVAADIIDYKTNSSVPKDPDKLRAFVEREHYDEQLNKYRREVEKMYNIQGKVTARLLFTDCQKDKTTGKIKPIVRLFEVQP